MKLVNLTPHEVVLHAGTTTLVVAPSGTVARVTTQDKEVGAVPIGGSLLPLVQSVYGDVDGLPEPEPDTMYIVSGLVAAAAGRDDLVVPHDLVRDMQGRIVGARALRRG